MLLIVRASINPILFIKPISNIYLHQRHAFSFWLLQSFCYFWRRLLFSNHSNNFLCIDLVRKIHHLITFWVQAYNGPVSKTNSPSHARLSVLIRSRWVLHRWGKGYNGIEHRMGRVQFGFIKFDWGRKVGSRKSSERLCSWEGDLMKMTIMIKPG